jgi:hypothetical protein
MPLAAWCQGDWQGRLLDLGHLPLFAALTLLPWACLGPGLSRPVLIALAVAGVAEVVQGWVGRTPDPLDFLRGALGALAAAGYLLLAAALLAWPVLDAAPPVLDAYEGTRAFPTLADYGRPRELLRWHCRQAGLARVPDPSHPDSWAGRLDFFPGPGPHTSGAIRPVVRDFSAYRRLCCAFRVGEGPPQLVVSVRSGRGSRCETHYQVQRLYPAGEHSVRFDLAAVAPKAGPRPPDLPGVEVVQFFVYSPEGPAPFTRTAFGWRSERPCRASRVMSWF